MFFRHFLVMNDVEKADWVGVDKSSEGVSARHQRVCQHVIRGCIPLPRLLSVPLTLLTVHVCVSHAPLLLDAILPRCVERG